jgi:hypothetical protein
VALLSSNKRAINVGDMLLVLSFGLKLSGVVGFPLTQVNFLEKVRGRGFITFTFKMSCAFSFVSLVLEVSFLLKCEFQKFFTSLAVLPGSLPAISDHLHKHNI